MKCGNCPTIPDYYIEDLLDLGQVRLLYEVMLTNYEQEKNGVRGIGLVVSDISD